MIVCQPLVDGVAEEAAVGSSTQFCDVGPQRGLEARAACSSASSRAPSDEVDRAVEHEPADLSGNSSAYVAPSLVP